MVLSWFLLDYLYYGAFSDPVISDYFLDGKFYGLKLLTESDLRANLDLLNVLSGLGLEPKWFICFMMIAFITIMSTLVFMSVKSGLKSKIKYAVNGVEKETIECIILIVFAILMVFNTMYNYNTDKAITMLVIEGLGNEQSCYVKRAETLKEQKLEHYVEKDGSIQTVYKVPKDIILGVIKSTENLKEYDNVGEAIPHIYVLDEELDFLCVDGDSVVYVRK